jgi:hypothetical protein
MPRKAGATEEREQKGGAILLRPWTHGRDGGMHASEPPTQRRFVLAAWCTGWCLLASSVPGRQPHHTHTHTHTLL